MKNNSMFKTTLAVAIAISGAITASHAAAGIVSFNIGQTYTQGNVSDLSATSISLGGAGNFILDPGSSGDYFDFKFNSGTFSTINTAISGYYFLRSYGASQTIGAGDFGVNESTYDDWDTILVSNQTAGVWGSSHNGYLGFLSDNGMYGWINYNFTRTSSSTLTLLNGAYNDVAGTGIVTGELISSPAVPVPAAAWLLGSGLLGLIGVARRKAA